MTLAAPFTLSDNKLGTVCTISTGTMAPGATQTCSISYNLTSADLAAGSVTNTASVTAFYNGVQIAPGTASATLITYTGARLGISKTPSQYFYTSTGQQITYTYKLVNTGGVPLVVNSGYALTDNKIGTITCVAIGNLPVGGSALCNTGSYTITTADTVSVTNTVSATGSSTTTPATTATGDQKTIYMCPPTGLTGASGTFATPASEYVWSIYNSNQQPIYVASLTITWDSGGVVALKQVDLSQSGTQVGIWTGSDTSGAFTVPTAASWNLTSLKNDLHLLFSGTASNVHVSITISGCSSYVLNSN